MISQVIKVVTFLSVIAVSSGFKIYDNRWVTLLDKDLSQWEMYLSYRHKDNYDGGFPKDEKGDSIRPIGYNNNVNNVFSVIEQDHETTLRVSGEIYGCIFTKKEYENYHLKLKVKWGTQKWEPRLDKELDSGVLYHSQGACGVDYWRSWMLSQELQIIENSMGDFWSIASSQIDINAKKASDTSQYQYSKNAPYVSFGVGTSQGNFCQSQAHIENPNGQWNTVELICFRGKSIHIINGKVVMALANSRYKDGDILKPLTKGKIQIQSEAGEVYYKDISILPIKKLPKKYNTYFN